ncbi:hypothetical protein ACHQM5_008709 [Ranunculus cassubicifolius]
MVLETQPPAKYTWKIENFSSLEGKRCFSPTFTAGDHNWRIEALPDGKYLSLKLDYADHDKLGRDMKVVYVELKLRVIDQINQENKEIGYTGVVNCGFRSMGWSNFVPLEDLNKQTGFLVNDVCVVEAEFVVQGTPMRWN